MTIHMESNTYVRQRTPARARVGESVKISDFSTSAGGARRNRLAVLGFAVYGLSFHAAEWSALKTALDGLVATATAGAFGGADLAARVLKKATLRARAGKRALTRAAIRPAPPAGSHAGTRW